MGYKILFRRRHFDSEALNGNQSDAVADALAARGVPLIFSTGYSGRDMSEGYRDRPVLKKPFPYEELVEVLTHLLSR
jgi:hypothetical protein